MVRVNRCLATLARLSSMAVLLAGVTLPAIAARAAVHEIFATGETTDCNEEFENVANSLQPGDELILHDGEYWQSCRRAITVNGTVANPIVIRAADGARPVLTRAADDFNDNNIEIDGAHFTLRGLVFRGGSAGVRFLGGQSITFEDNEIFNTANNALNMNSGSTDSFVIRNNHIHDTGIVGDNTEGEGMYVGCHPGNCVASNHLIEGNHIHHLRGTSSGGNDGIELKFRSHSNIVRGNLIHDTNIGTHYPCIFSYGGGAGDPNVIENNVVFNCGEAILVTADTIVRNNVILNSSSHGIHARAQSPSPLVQNVAIVSNTIYGTHPKCVQLRWSSATNVVFANNAVYCENSTAVQFDGLANATVASNYVVGAVSGAAIDNAAFFDGGSAAANFTDPANDDFHLLTGSALIDAGDNSIADLADTDHDGNARIDGAAVDIGAFEFGAAPSSNVAVALTASSASVTQGDSVTLSWTSSGAVSCTASGGWSGARAINGSEAVGPLTATTTFSLSCSDATSTVSDAATVTVQPLPLPTVSLSASPAVIDEGDEVTLTWLSTDADSCVASGNWSGARPSAGGETIDAVTSDGLFTLTCSNDRGSASASANVTVNLADADQDGLEDAWELLAFGDLAQTASGDTDSDGLDNLGEFSAGTDPLDRDSDGDGATDGAEVDAGTDPTNPNDSPSVSSNGGGGDGGSGALGVATLLLCLLAFARRRSGGVRLS